MVIGLPPEAELAVQEKDCCRYYFVLNYSEKPIEVELKEEFEDCFAGEKASGTKAIEGYGVRVYKA